MDEFMAIGAKVVLKVGMNAVVPMSSSVLEFKEAFDCVANDDIPEACIHILSGVTDMFTFGMLGAAKGVAQAGGKEVAIQTTKQTACEMTKKIGQAAAVEIAREGLTGTAKRKVIASAKQSSKEATKIIGRSFAKDLSEGMVENAIEQAFKDGTETNSKSIAISSIRGAIETGGKDLMQGGFHAGLEETLTGATDMLAKKSNKKFLSTEAFEDTKEFATETCMDTATNISILKGVSSCAIGILRMKDDRNTDQDRKKD